MHPCTCHHCYEWKTLTIMSLFWINNRETRLEATKEEESLLSKSSSSLHYSRRLAISSPDQMKQRREKWRVWSQTSFLSSSFRSDVRSGFFSICTMHKFEPFVDFLNPTAIGGGNGCFLEEIKFTRLGCRMLHRKWNNGSNEPHRPTQEWFHFLRNILCPHPVHLLGWIVPDMVIPSTQYCHLTADGLKSICHAPGGRILYTMKSG